MSSLAEIVKIKTKSPDPKIIRRIVLTLKRGGLIAFPTDTVFGLGGLSSKRTLIRLMNLKKKEAARPIGIFVASVEQVKQLAGEISGYAKALIKEFWPGPLTLVFKSSVRLHKPLVHPGTIGIRIPDQNWLLSVLRKLEMPLLQTSANLSGQSPLRTGREVQKVFGERLDLIVEAVKIKRTKPSTVVDVSGPVPIILRKGAISKRRLEKALKRKINAAG